MEDAMGRRRKTASVAVVTTKAVAYARVSTSEQASEGVSLDAQEARLRAYAEVLGLELVMTLREEAVSGTVPLRERPEGARLLAALESGEVQHVLAVKLDRLFRNAGDARDQALAWNTRGVALKLVDFGGAPLDTASPLGKFFFLMLAGVAELERDLIADRTSVALRQKQTKGEHVGRPPRGSRIESKRLVMDHDGLRLYRRATELRGQGLTYQAVAATLEEEGHAPVRGRRLWPSAVYKLVNNPSLARIASEVA